MLYRNWSSHEWRPQALDDELMLLKVFMHITPVCLGQTFCKLELTIRFDPNKYTKHDVCLGQTACKLELMICFDSNKYTKHDVILYMYVS